MILTIDMHVTCSSLVCVAWVSFLLPHTTQPDDISHHAM